MKKIFEYKKIFHHDIMKLGGSKEPISYDPSIELKALNKLGDDGWELVGVHGGNQPDYYFKTVHQRFIYI